MGFARTFFGILYTNWVGQKKRRAGVRLFEPDVQGRSGDLGVVRAQASAESLMTQDEGAPHRLDHEDRQQCRGGVERHGHDEHGLPAVARRR